VPGNNDSSNLRRFAIAMSFPGERRDYVEQVAKALLPAFGGEEGKARIFYDNWHESLIIGYASNRKLQDIYTDSDLIVPFYCQDYRRKKWCGAELRVIEQLLLEEEFDRVLPFRFDQVEIPSTFKTDIVLDVSGRSPEDIARLILDRYRALHPVKEETGGRTAAIQADISRITKYAPSDLIGREAETKLLSDAWDQIVRGDKKRPHILTFVALGGEGKTSVVAKWAADLAFQDWPGCEAVLAWSFYSQGTREQLAASSDLFLNEALTFFGDAAMAGSSAGAFDKGRRLARLAGERRALLILDGLEPLQYAPTSPTPGELKDLGLAALLKGLASTSRGLCVITTRYSIPDLRAFVGKTVEEHKLARLSTEAGVALLQSFGVKGSLRKNIPGADGRTLWNELEKLVEDVKGHALTLNLLGSYLRDAHAGDIRKRDLIKLEEANAEEQGGHAFHVMDAYVAALATGGKTADDQAKGRRALALLRLLGLFDRPATADTLAALWEGEAIAGLTEPLVGISEAQRNLALQRLEDAKLLTVSRAPGVLVALDAHPLLREYFGQRLRATQPEAWRAAHRRLYEHLCATTKDKPDATLEDLQPLYQAVAHGCHAGLQQEACDKVYRDRIQRGQEAYGVKKLGAFGSDLGAVACFFENPWSRVSPLLTEAAQAWLLHQAAFRLRALGRLTEALEPMRVSAEMDVKVGRWTGAAIGYGNLSELELTLGEVAEALVDVEQSVTYADRSGDAFQRMARRTTHADALHQAGRRDEAEARFREAEQMQAESQPDYALLYSLRGFRYCDLLLAEAEREAGKEGESKKEQCLALCRAVSERATQTFEWAERNKFALLTIALDHLTLGRAALYAAILESRSGRRESTQTSSAPPSPEESQLGFTSAATELDQAVSGLRRAAAVEFLVCGILTRAWLRSLTGARTGSESAQSDLDEAWEIAERGPMPLFLADIHLYRARLFFREAECPWQSPQHDLAEARRLIFKHGYLRRKEELEDAEGLILGDAEI
jgi:tetratricopeptide (TPR) repeat protein